MLKGFPNDRHIFPNPRTMRRLPIYFLIDVSESMVGEPIQRVEEGLATIIQTLKTNPHALETVWVSIIVFAGQPRTLVPLQELVSFYPPKFPIGSGTSLANGLGHLMFELRRNVKKNTSERKGDWKPIVFLFTDGVPTDDTTAAIGEWKRNWARGTNTVAVSFGDEADTQVLRQLTDDVLHFKNTDAEAYAKFFRWISDSISASSESVENNGSGFDIRPIEEDVIEKIDEDSTLNRRNRVDPNFAVLVGKCQNTEQPYLMKYRKTHMPSRELPGMYTQMYKLQGAFRVDKNYWELGGDEGGSSGSTMNTEELWGAPTCPCCGNQIAFAMCQCGNIHCIEGPSVAICPWCKREGHYMPSQGGGFDINRTRG